MILRSLTGLRSRGILCLDKEVGCSDTVLLDPLTEDMFINNLQIRFSNNQIYTYIGNVVVSMNPYKKLPLYTNEIIQAYQNYSRFELPPHIFSIADDAYRSMRDNNFDQCVIITGESGAGKTEASKIIMQYVAAASGKGKEVDTIKEQLLQSNPLLEAFGNAKTCRNDNSSRFGKYMDLEFDFKGDPLGGIITNYLLEKSRVVHQAQGEGNFHIFYQLLNGGDVQFLKKLKLKRGLENYALLKESHHFNTDADDRSNFSVTKKAMEIVGFQQDEIFSIFQIVASVLKLGNIQFQNLADSNHGMEGCCLLNEYEHFDVCELLQCDFETLKIALTQRTIKARHDVVVIYLSASEAAYAKDALCKALYSRLFTWIIHKVNDSIKAKQIGRRKCLGVLDIYGFEVFQNNGFEQFIINYCNEKLQQIFIELTLKQEQEEYIREGIQWNYIDYFNNSVICDLIEVSNYSILALLDEECLRPGAVSDKTLFYKLSHYCNDSPYFESRSCQGFLSDSSLPHLSFRLRHYAGPVVYSVLGFMDKNNDLLYRDLSQAMYHCNHPLLKDLFPEGNPKRSILKRPATTATQFKMSISALVENLNTKNPNYVRCIKSNDLKQCDTFDRDLVQHQVRYLGLMENVRVRRAGYAYRENYENFLRRFKMLSIHTWPSWNESAEDGVKRIISDLPIHSSECSFGRSKIFIKNPSTLFELEEFRRQRLNDLATLVQKIWRGFMQRRRYLNMKKSQIIIAAEFRRWKMRRTYLKKRQAVTTISAYYHGWKVRQNYRKFFQANAAKVLSRAIINYTRRNYLLKLRNQLPSESPLSHEWPSSPQYLWETNCLLCKLYHKWRCHKYRSKIDQVTYNKMKEKLTASLLFKGKKVLYEKSVSHPFCGDYVRLRQNVKWQKIAKAQGDQHVVFADIVNKITRSNGKCVQILFVISTNAVLIMDQRTLQIRYRVPVKSMYKISLSPFADDIAVFHMKSNEFLKRKGDFLFESDHIIEITTKLYMIIRNSGGNPTVQITNEFEANFGKENVAMSFKQYSQPEQQHLGPIRIIRKGNHMEILLR